MERTNTTTPTVSLTIRGVIYILAGILLAIFINTHSALIGYISGGLLVVSGLLVLWLGFTRQRSDKNFIWTIFYGLTDVCFAVLIISAASGTVRNVLDAWGFWAIVYAFLQTVQAMYTSMVERRGPGANVGGQSIHFILVLVSVGFAFVLSHPFTFPDGMQWMIGLFLVIFGGLVIALGRQLGTGLH